MAQIIYLQDRKLEEILDMIGCTLYEKSSHDKDNKTVVMDDIIFSACMTLLACVCNGLADGKIEVREE
jgi:hypothetical protein